MNKILQMRYYHALRKTNPALSKSKAGRSIIMKESVCMVKLQYNIFGNYKYGFDLMIHMNYVNKYYSKP